MNASNSKPRRATLWLLAMFSASSLLFSGCRTGGGVTVSEGGHLTFVRKADGLACAYTPMTNAAALCERNVLIVTDTGLRLLLKLDVKPPR